jgi:hypothetical protein
MGSHTMFYYSHSYPLIICVLLFLFLLLLRYLVLQEHSDVQKFQNCPFCLLLALPTDLHPMGFSMIILVAIWAYDLIYLMKKIKVRFYQLKLNYRKINLIFVVIPKLEFREIF